MDNKLEQFIYAAIGSALSTKDKIEQNDGELKAYQQQAEQAGKAWFDSMIERVSNEKQRAKDGIKTLLKEVIGELGLATKEDLQQLKKDMES